jgi:hypothetical protein
MMMVGLLDMTSPYDQATSEKARILRCTSFLVVAAYDKVRLTSRELVRLVSEAFCEAALCLYISQAANTFNPFVLIAKAGYTT